MKKRLLTITLFVGVPICLLVLLFGLTLSTSLVTAQTVPESTETPPGLAAQLTETASLEVMVGVGREHCRDTSTSLNVQAGEILYFCYRARNTGDTAFARHLITDTPFGSSPFAFDAPLPAGEAITVERAITMVATNSFTSNAIWQAWDSSALYSVTATGPTITVNVSPNAVNEQQDLKLDVTVGVNPAVCGNTDEIAIPENSTAEFCLRLTNEGDEPLESHTISASIFSPPTESTPISRTQVLTIPVYGLLPGQTVEFTSVLLRDLNVDNPVLAQNFSDDARVHWDVRSFTRDDGESPVKEFLASDSATVTVLQTGLSIRKYPNITPTDCNESADITVSRRQAIYYCLVLDNTGDIEFTEHTFVDTASGVGGSFRYPLKPKEELRITHATLPSIPGLTADPLPSLGPFTESVTVTHTLTWTARNDEGYQITAGHSGKINVPILPLELILVRTNSPSACPGGSTTNAIPVGTQVWYCVRLRNTSATTITHHSFMQYMTPPSQPGARYAYTAGTSFQHSVGRQGNDTSTILITTDFLTRTLQRPAILGPYTIHTPVNGTLRFTNTVIYTASNPALGYQVVARASDVANLSQATAQVQPTSTPTPVPTNTSPPTAVPSETETPTMTPTPTMVQISALNFPTPSPTPQLSILPGGVSTPLPGQFNSPLAAPVDPSAAVVVGTPTFTPDIMLLAATQTMDAMVTETAVALLLTPTETFTPPPTATETPLPTHTPTETPSPTPSPSPTSTQRPVGQAPSGEQPTGLQLLEGVLASAAAAAGWIWFIGGSLTFFITAGIVAGLTLRPAGRIAPEAEDDFTPLPTPRPYRRVKPKAQPPTTAADEDDHWPASLP